MDKKTLKVLVAGDVAGKCSTLFKRVENIQKKSGTFDMLLCVGDFFGMDNSDWEQFQTGKAKVPLPTYILGPNEGKMAVEFPDINGCELCDNLTYLGKKGIYKGSSGLQIAYLSGKENTDSSTDTEFSKDDILSLTQPLLANSKFQGVDILLTSQWPKGVEKYGSVPESVDSTSCGSELISQLAIQLKPRYHFSGLQNSFYERQPYRNHKVLQEGARHVTRFIAMAKTGNPAKKKYLYAFNITPMSLMEQFEITKQPQDATECPYKSDPNMFQQDSDKGKSNQYFYDMNASKNHKSGKRPNQHGGDQPRKKNKGPQPQGPCWFCLSSPEVEKHLVVSVGEEVYVALAKGGLTSEHVLILPIAHHQSTVLLPPEAITEIDKYKTALKKCFKKQGKAVVFFERNYKSSHLQIQAVPVPFAANEELLETFQQCSQADGFELHEIPKHSDLKQIVPAGAPYFYAELPSGDKLLHRIKKNFPLQFGREVLCQPGILNMTERVDWKNCKTSKDEESGSAQEFREMFEPYDFNLD